MKNMLIITLSIVGLTLVTTGLSTGQLLAQVPGLNVPPVNKEIVNQENETKVPEAQSEKPALSPFSENDPDQPVDKEEALKQWEAQQKEAADTAKEFRNGQRRGQQIIIRKSFTTVNQNGEKQTESSGKMVIVGPDGERKEIELDGGDEMEPLNLNIPRIGWPAIRPNQPNAVNAKEGFAIGSVYRPVNDAMRSQLDLGDRGLLVLSVSDGSPAAKAGIKKYDILIFADDKELETKEDLESVVEIAGKEKQTFSLGLIRKGKELTVEVSPIEKSKLRSGNVVRFGNNMNFAQPLPLPNHNNFGKLEEEMHQQMLEHMQRLEQEMEQFNIFPQGLELQNKK